MARFLLLTSVFVAVVQDASSQCVPSNHTFAECPRLQHRRERDASKVTLRVLGGGQGTTATHALFEILCRLGVKTCHFQKCCNVFGQARRMNDDLVQLYALIGMCIMNDENTLRKHCGLACDLQSFQVDEKYKPCAEVEYDTDTCCNQEVLLYKVIPKFSRGNPCIKRMGCRVAELLENVEELMWRLATSGIEALIDSPTANFLGTFRSIFPESSFRILLTTRDPKVWSKKRISEHSDPMYCSNENGARLGDFGKCMRSALEGHTLDRPLLVDDAFVPISGVSAEAALIQHQEYFIPSLVQTFVERAGETQGRKHGYWFMEFDVFEQTINGLPSETKLRAKDAQLTAEFIHEQRVRYQNEVAREVEKWLIQGLFRNHSQAQTPGPQAIFKGFH